MVHVVIGVQKGVVCDVQAFHDEPKAEKCKAQLEKEYEIEKGEQGENLNPDNDVLSYYLPVF